MKHKLSVFCLIVLIFGMLIWGGTALSVPQGNTEIELFWYSYSHPLTTQPQIEAKHVLLCVYRNGAGNPALLYQNQSDQRYYPIQQQSFQPFKDVFLGFPQVEQGEIARFQEALGEGTDGDWGAATWSALIEYLGKALENQEEKIVKFPADSEQPFLTAKVVNLNQIDLDAAEAVTLKYVLKSSNVMLETHESNKLATFAPDLNLAYQIYQAITSPQRQSETTVPEVETETEENATEQDKQKTESDDELKLPASLDRWQIIKLASIFLFISLITGFVLWWLITGRVQENGEKISKQLGDAVQGFNRLIQEHHKSTSDIIQKEQTAAKQDINTNLKSEIEKSRQQHAELTGELKADVSNLKEDFNRSQQLKWQTEQIKGDCESQLQQMMQQYVEGYGIELEDYGNNNLALLNRLALHIAEWKSEIEQQQAPQGLYQIINSGEKYLTSILRRIRENSPEPPTQIQIDTHIIQTIQQECQRLVGEFKKELEIREQKDAKQLESIPNANESLRKFVLDHLFEGVANLFPHNGFPQHFITTLSLAGLEMIPIDIGRTKADPRLHDIQGTKPQPDSADMIVEVVFPGLRDANTQEVIRKPVVIKGE